jgi:putative ABC transport system substrate-binding protein
MLNPTTAGSSLNLRTTETASRTLRVQIIPLEVRSSRDIEAAFDAAARAQVGGLLVTQAPPITTHSKEVMERLELHRLPAIYPQSQWPDNGGLMSYGDNMSQSLRYLATYVEKILRGAKPAELPIERSAKLEFVVNIKAAKQIGLTIPPNVLARADRVIK